MESQQVVGGFDWNDAFAGLDVAYQLEYCTTTAVNLQDYHDAYVAFLKKIGYLGADEDFSKIEVADVDPIVLFDFANINEQ